MRLDQLPGRTKTVRPFAARFRSNGTTTEAIAKRRTPMFTPRRLSASCFLILCLFAPVLAQGEQRGKAEGTIPQPGSIVPAAATADRVRFTSPNSVVQMHLQVYDNAGQLVFDVSSKGNVLDWTLQDGGGGRLNPGSYLSVVTVKSLSGKLSQRIGSVSVQEKQTELLQADAAQITSAQQQAIGPVEENAALTILKAGETEATTVVAHGGAGTLTDSVIRETGGKVGVGVNNPTYRLVVGPDIGPGLTTSDLTISRGPGESVSIFAGATGAHGMIECYPCR